MPDSIFDPTFQVQLQEIYGIDLYFDLGMGLKGTKDCVANQDNTDLIYVNGVQALAQEIQRMFDLTPKGSCLGDGEDLAYGIDWDFVGQPNNPDVMVGLVKAVAIQALQHPSFAGRLQVAAMEASYDPTQPNAISLAGVLEVKGFEGIEFWRFGPMSIRYLLEP